MRAVDDGLGTIHIFTGTKSNGKQFQELMKDYRYLEQEIVDLKRELTEEKKAYNRMYNMYVEKDNIINELEKCIDERIIRTKKEPIREKERNRILYNLAYILDKIKELKGEDKE